MYYKFRNYNPEIIYTVGPYPLNLIGIIERSPNLKLTDAIKTVLGLPDLMFYDFNHINEKYDNITYIEWVKEKKIPQDIYGKRNFFEISRNISFFFKLKTNRYHTCTSVVCHFERKACNPIFINAFYELSKKKFFKESFSVLQKCLLIFKFIS